MILNGIDWGASGLVNTFAYELIDMFDINLSLGWLDNVTGGKITEEYRGDNRTALMLDFDGAAPDLNKAVRVWHTARLGKADFTECLGTFICTDPSADYLRGRRSGSASYQSMIYRLSQDIRINSRSCAASSNAVSTFKDMVISSGGTPYVPSNFSTSKTIGTDLVFEQGKSVASCCNTLADYMSPKGYLMPDAFGRVAMQVYQNPAKRAPVWDLDSSMLLEGVTITEPEIVNRVGMSATVNDVEYAGDAQAPTTHPWAFRRLGYHVTKAESGDVGDTTDPSTIQSMLNTQAQSRLDEYLSAKRKYGCTALYWPAQVGQVGNISYRDSDADEGIQDKVMLAQREITLDAKMTVELTLEAV